MKTKIKKVTGDINEIFLLSKLFVIQRAGLDDLQSQMISDFFEGFRKNIKGEITTLLTSETYVSQVILLAEYDDRSSILSRINKAVGRDKYILAIRFQESIGIGGYGIARYLQIHVLNPKEPEWRENLIKDIWFSSGVRLHTNDDNLLFGKNQTLVKICKRINDDFPACIKVVKVESDYEIYKRLMDFTSLLLASIKPFNDIYNKFELIDEDGLIAE
jgi:hypothetical protein